MHVESMMARGGIIPGESQRIEQRALRRRRRGAGGGGGSSGVEVRLSRPEVRMMQMSVMMVMQMNS